MALFVVKTARGVSRVGIKNAFFGVESSPEYDLDVQVQSVPRLRVRVALRLEVGTMASIWRA